MIFVLIALGALIHEPNNYDAHTYRIPRILHWWANNSWEWVQPIVNNRINYSGTGIEWASLPILILSKSIRPLVFINLIAFALLPGLIFSVFKKLGVSHKVAWYAMWVFPTALCFLMQAGGIGNDLPGAVTFLSALNYALRWKEHRSGLDLILSTGCMALTTGIKATNTPLCLPWVFILLIDFKMLRRQWLAASAGILIGLSVSLVPTAIQNTLHTGHWSGLSSNHPMRIKDPLAGLTGNTLQLAVGLLEPPVNPFSERIRQMTIELLPDVLIPWLIEEFPKFRLDFREMPREETAGPGLFWIASVGLLLGFSRHRSLRKIPIAGLIAGGCTLISVVVYMLMAGSESTARLLTPYYLPLSIFPLLWIEDQVQKFWRAMKGVGVILMITALVPLILSPSRPLWPWHLVISALPDSVRNHAAAQRAVSVYNGYAQRSDAFRPIRKYFAPDCNTIGLVTNGDDPETGLWRPFGKRRVVQCRLLPILDNMDIDCLVARKTDWEKAVKTKKLKQELWQKTAEIPIVAKVRDGPEIWLVLVKGSHKSG
jgi:hypothetical protein